MEIHSFAEPSQSNTMTLSTPHLPPRRTLSILLLLPVLVILLPGYATAQQTITLQPGGQCGKDAILHGLDSERNTNYGNNAQLPAVAWTFSGTPGTIRGVVEFNLSSIPANAVINSAYLSLYAWGQNNGLGQHSSLSGSNIGWIQRVTTMWDEQTVTWNTQPSTTSQNQVVLHESNSPNEDYLNMDVTALVQDMLDNPSSSFGFLISEQVESYYRRLNFCSSDHTDPARRPKLVITYTGIGNPGQQIDLGPDTEICPGQVITLSGYMTNANYLWQNGSTGSTFQVTGPGTYWVQTTSGCSAGFSDTIVISPGDCIGDTLVDTLVPTDPVIPALLMPNVFTPGSDHLNDAFTPVSSNLPAMHTTILNRWGERVFETDDPAINWTGDDQQHKPVSAGVYFWIVDYSSGNTKQRQHGSVTVIR
jgi:gliding motility-associated-like protein